MRDFETLLEFIGSEGIESSGKYGHLPQKSLIQLNTHLTHPIEIDLKRPMQKSFPHINGLYLLLRASGLGYIKEAGKKQKLALDDEVLESWRTLNPTERYFTLLDTWIFHGDPEILGESRRIFESPMVGWRKLFGSILEDRDWVKVAGHSRIEPSIAYFPGLTNLALLELFGFVAVQHTKPEEGKGWRIAEMQRTSWGDAVAGLLFQDELVGLFFFSDARDEYKHGELQPVFQPFFPEWQHNLVLPTAEFQEGTHIFKVSLGKVWRRIAISATMQLEDLSDAILAAYKFDRDHLYCFSYRNRFGVSVDVNSPLMEESPPWTDEVRIGDLCLSPGRTITYLFDFGDNWEFEVKLERIEPVDPKLKKPRIIESHGKAPEQYGESSWFE